MDPRALLESLDMSQYLPAFEAEQVDAGVLPLLTDDDLLTLGVRPLGHRRRILAAIADGARRPVPRSRPPASDTPSRAASADPAAWGERAPSSVPVASGPRPSIPPRASSRPPSAPPRAVRVPEDANGQTVNLEAVRGPPSARAAWEAQTRHAGWRSALSVALCLVALRPLTVAELAALLCRGGVIAHPSTAAARRLVSGWVRLGAVSVVEDGVIVHPDARPVLDAQLRSEPRRAAQRVLCAPEAWTVQDAATGYLLRYGAAHLFATGDSAEAIRRVSDPIHQRVRLARGGDAAVGLLEDLERGVQIQGPHRASLGRLLLLARGRIDALLAAGEAGWRLWVDLCAADQPVSSAAHWPLGAHLAGAHRTPAVRGKLATPLDGPAAWLVRRGTFDAGARGTGAPSVDRVEGAVWMDALGCAVWGQTESKPVFLWTLGSQKTPGPWVRPLASPVVRVVPLSNASAVVETADGGVACADLRGNWWSLAHPGASWHGFATMDAGLAVGALVGVSRSGAVRLWVERDASVTADGRSWFPSSPVGRGHGDPRQDGRWCGVAPAPGGGVALWSTDGQLLRWRLSDLGWRVRAHPAPVVGCLPLHSGVWFSWSEAGGGRFLDARTGTPRGPEWPLGDVAGVWPAGGAGAGVLVLERDGCLRWWTPQGVRGQLATGAGSVSRASLLGADAVLLGGRPDGAEIWSWTQRRRVAVLRAPEDWLDDWRYARADLPGLLERLLPADLTPLDVRRTAVLARQGAGQVVALQLGVDPAGGGTPLDLRL